MLGAQLGSHSQCLCIPEALFWVETLQHWEGDLQNIDPLKVIRKIEIHPRFKIWGLNLDTSVWDKSSSPTTYAELIEWIVLQYGNKHQKPAPSLWVDQTPSNMKYAATLFSIFPRAKMIHLVRDGRAVVSSIMALGWFGSVDRATYYWLEKLSHGLAAESLYGPERILRVRYEDLVSSPEETLRSLCKFMEIEYQPRMVNGDGLDLPVFAQRTHALVGQSPIKSRINAWETELTTREVEIFENIAGDMLTFLGYTPKYGARARELKDTERVASFLNYIRSIGNFYYNRYRVYWYGYIKRKPK